MQDRVAVWTYGPQIRNGINRVLGTHIRERAQVMHVDDAVHFRPVDLAEIEPADTATRPVTPNAGPPRGWVPLIGVHRDSDSRQMAVQSRSVAPR